jgi:hypothetical protein
MRRSLLDDYSSIDDLLTTNDSHAEEALKGVK